MKSQRIDWKTQLNRLISDRCRGAVPLTAATARLLMSMERRGVSLDRIRSAVRSVQKAHRSMAPLWHLSRTVAASRRETVKGHLIEFLSLLKQQSDQAVRRLAQELLSGTVMTHSFSSLVFRGLVEAKRLGRKVRVICTESRPGSEGVKLAGLLTEAGLPVTLVPDVQFFRWIGECQLILLGADALLPDGLVHKVGTYLLACEARRRRVPVWSVATSLKWMPVRWQLPMIGVACRIAPEPIRQDLSLYDLTPWHLISRVILEDRIISGRRVPEVVSDLTRGKGDGER